MSDKDRDNLDLGTMSDLTLPAWPGLVWLGSVVFDAQGRRAVVTWPGDTALGNEGGGLSVGPNVWVAYIDRFVEPPIDLLERREITVALTGNGAKTSRAHVAWWCRETDRYPWPEEELRAVIDAEMGRDMSTKQIGALCNLALRLHGGGDAG